MSPFYTPWKHQKTVGFLLFSGSIGWENWGPFKKYVTQIWWSDAAQQFFCSVSYKDLIILCEQQEEYIQEVVFTSEKFKICFW